MYGLFRPRPSAAIVPAAAAYATSVSGYSPSRSSFRSPKLPPLTVRVAAVRCIERASGLFRHASNTIRFNPSATITRLEPLATAFLLDGLALPPLSWGGTVRRVLVEELRSQVGTGRPHDGVELGVDAKAPEDVQVLQEVRRPRAFPQFVFQVDARPSRPSSNVT